MRKSGVARKQLVGVVSKELLFITDALPYPEYSACLSQLRSADERARTADLSSLRVINRALQGFAEASKYRISKPASFLCLTPCCTVLCSRWCQSGVTVDWKPRQQPRNVWAEPGPAEK